GGEDERPDAVVETVLQEPCDVDGRGMQEEMAAPLLRPLDDGGRPRLALLVLDVAAAADRGRGPEQGEVRAQDQAPALEELELVVRASRQRGAERPHQLDRR